jgi:hypothetical protein
MRARGAVVSMAVVLAGAAVLLTGCSSNPTGALSRLAHLDQGSPVASHIEPPVVPGVDADLVDTSVRLLAERDGTAFWVGVTSDDDVCFIAAPAPAGLEPSGTDAGTTAGGPADAAGSPTASPAASPSSADDDPATDETDATDATDAIAGVGFGPPTAAPRLPVPSLALAEPEAVCLSPESFGAHGATLRLGTERTRVWLHTEYMTVATGWVPIAQNLAVKSV